MIYDETNGLWHEMQGEHYFHCIYTKGIKPNWNFEVEVFDVNKSMLTSLEWSTFIYKKCFNLIDFLIYIILKLAKNLHYFKASILKT